jgi:hypothetical protein
VAVTGCSKPSEQSSEPVAPEQTVADSPVEEDTSNAATPGVEKDERRYHYYAPYGPPAHRYEDRGRAPSERHFWAPGYYRWNGREHVWYNGRWEHRREGYEYRGPRWVNTRGRWEYNPGLWVRVRL